MLHLLQAILYSTQIWMYITIKALQEEIILVLFVSVVNLWKEMGYDTPTVQTYIFRITSGEK